jgi:hypothetical protein
MTKNRGEDEEQRKKEETLTMKNTGGDCSRNCSLTSPVL